MPVINGIKINKNDEAQKIQPTDVCQSILKNKNQIIVGEPLEIKIGKNKFLLSIKNLNSDNETDKINEHLSEIISLKKEFSKVSKFKIEFNFYHDINVEIEGYWDSHGKFFSNYNKIIAFDYDYLINFKTKSNNKIGKIIVNNLCIDNGKEVLFEMLYETDQWKNYSNKIKAFIKDTVSLSKKIGIDADYLYNQYIYED